MQSLEAEKIRLDVAITAICGTIINNFPVIRDKFYWERHFCHHAPQHRWRPGDVIIIFVGRSSEDVSGRDTVSTSSGSLHKLETVDAVDV